jgi:TldD protein
MARLLDATLGQGTEVDRALGYEANASGTSYLGPDPLTFLGTPVAHEMVTVTANRSLPTGLATVKWDADGVTPEDFTIVKAGTLVDYQTTREQATWLAPWYTKAGTPIRSHGCAAAQDALCFPMQHTPNLALAPAATDASFEDLVAGLSDGIAIQKGFVETDFQCKNGIIRAYGPPQGSYIFQVKNGKRVAKLSHAGILFNATDLWKNVTVLGGAASVQHVPCSEVKGEPSQTTKHTVSVPPGVFKELPMIDLTRKA